jgi:hypothetical protein
MGDMVDYGVGLGIGLFAAFAGLAVFEHVLGERI